MQIEEDQIHQVDGNQIGTKMRNDFVNFLTK